MNCIRNVLIQRSIRNRMPYKFYRAYLLEGQYLVAHVTTLKVRHRVGGRDVKEVDNFICSNFKLDI